MENNITNISYIPSPRNCSFYLPCGVCTRTNTMCPLGEYTMTPSWATLTSTKEIHITTSHFNEDGTITGQTAGTTRATLNREGEKADDRER